MFQVIFPSNKGQKYYDTHYLYVLNIFKDMGCSISYENRDGFVVTINGKTFLFDFADTSVPVNCSIPMFKMHCVKETDHIYSFPPVSFINWDDFRHFSSLVSYSGRGKISFRQRAYGNAKERRERVRKTLLARFGDVLVDTVEQKRYWYEINNVFLAVFVPGFCNNILDRAQFQYMALGCCTISPRLPEILPFGRYIIPNEHYIMCRDDYSDLTELIEMYMDIPDDCVEIGNNARSLFLSTSTPSSLIKWIERRL